MKAHPMKVVPIRLPQDLLQEVEVAVRQMHEADPKSGVTLSEVVRTSVRTWLRERARKAEYSRKRASHSRRLRPPADTPETT